MLNHYLTIIFRGLRRFKGSFIINMVSLSVGLACTLLLYLWITDELNVDKFHVNDQRLFQVFEHRLGTDDIHTSTTTSGIMGESLISEMPEIEQAINISWSQRATLSINGKNIKSKGYYAGETFFKMFSYNLIMGNENNVLTDISSIALSESLALKLFNSVEHALGQVVELQSEMTFPLRNQAAEVQAFHVSGVFSDIPQNASDHFDFIIPYQVYLKQNDWLSNWEITATRTYVLLKPDAEINGVDEKLKDYIKSKTNDKVSHRTPFLKRYSEIYLYSDYKNGVQSGGRITYVRLFSAVGLFVLLIASINFMNLTTAKATRRLKEVGIKKIVGASRSSLVFQYLFEALVISFFSIFIAVILVNIILPQFNEITDKNLVLIFNKRLILSILGMGLFTGLLAGSFPAFYISGLHAKDLFKGRISSSFNELWARKSLVVFQFSLSVIFIVSVLVIYNQLKFVQSANLGYERENIIYFAREGKLMDSAYLPTFLEELKNIPGIVEASTISHDMTGHNSGTTKIFWEGKNIEDKTEFERVMVNYNMVEALGLKMKSGRTFSKDFLSDETSIILNEAAIKHMDMEDPIGKTIKLDGSDMQIIGVVRDFNFESLHNYVKPLFLKLSPAETRLIMVKFFRSNEKQVLGRISAFYLKYNPGFSLDYQFLAANYQMQYETEQGMSTLSKYFAGLAIIISCLGLIGLAAFNTERRVKEIGIRKVLGASEFNIVRILSMDFTRLILISILIGTPTSYFILNSWLSGFAYRIELEWWYFLSTGIIILILSWLTIGLQTIKAATVDPVKNLRTE